MKFQKLGLDDRIVRSLQEEFLFLQATEIQKVAIPQILQSKNVLGIAPSGTGKTIAYLGPIIHRVINTSVDHNLPLGLILAPTRELAKQIEKEAIKLAKHCALNIVGIISHRSESKVSRQLKGQVDLIIGTPLKVKQFVHSKKLNISHIEQFVLDECDRLLEFGFYEVIEELYKKFSKNNNYNVHFFSATMENEMQKLLRQFMVVSPTIIEIARLKTANKLRQINYEVKEDEKLALTEELLHKKEVQSIIIFSRTQEVARAISTYLLNRGLELEETHGGLTERQRSMALKEFESGRVSVLVTTDLISRGINVPEVSHVLNFDIPKIIEDYIHRVGRTARAGKPGIAWNLIGPEDIYKIEKFEKVLGVRMHRKRRLEQADRVSKFEIKKIKKKEETRLLKLQEQKKKSRRPSFGKGWNYNYQKLKNKRNSQNLGQRKTRKNRR